ncbi:nuclease-related domain-containing protein [Acinetobacter baumannii]
MEIYFLYIGLALFGIFLWFKKYFEQKRKKEFGRQGEIIVDRKLRFWLGWGGAKIYDDVTFLTVSGNSTQIDHIVISKKGIFCIETKNLNGELKGRVEDKNWIHINRQGKKNTIYNPIFQNQSHINHLAKVLKVEPNAIEGFVTNVGDAKLKGNINPMFGKSAIEKGTGFIFFLWLRSKSKYTKEDVKAFTEKLEDKIQQADANIGDSHVDYVRKMKGENTGLFFLKYLYFVIFVLLAFIIYRIFY